MQTVSNSRGFVARRFAVLSAVLFTVYMTLGLLADPGVAALSAFWVLWASVMITAMATYAVGSWMRRSSFASDR
ncbi:MAG: hypothetical protein ABFR89_01295 [Actinomycetota bacterium]